MSKKSLFFILLFVVFCGNAILDKELTDIALENGYYETNDFTNKYGTTIHYFVLTCCVGMLSLFMFVTLPYWNVMVFLGILCLIWLFNNIYSLVIL